MGLPAPARTPSLEGQTRTVYGSRVKRKTWHFRRRATRAFLFRESFMARSDEAYLRWSDALIQRCVEETLKDPELREKIDYHARQIIKAIAAKL